MATIARSIASSAAFSTISRSATSNARQKGGSAIKRGGRFVRNVLDNTDTLFDIPSGPPSDDESLASDLRSTFTTSLSCVQGVNAALPKSRATRSIGTCLTFAKGGINAANTFYSSWSADSPSLQPSPSEIESDYPSATTGFLPEPTSYASKISSKYNHGWRRPTHKNGFTNLCALTDAPPPNRGHPSMQPRLESFFSAGAGPSTFAQSMWSNAVSSAQSPVWEADESVTAGSGTAETPLPLPARTEGIPSITVQTPIEPSFDETPYDASSYDSDDPSTAFTTSSRY